MPPNPTPHVLLRGIDSVAPAMKRWTGLLVLMVSLAGTACDSPEIIDIFPMPEDRTSVSVSPRDMDTAVPRQLLFDDDLGTVVQGPVLLEVVLYNTARPPTDAEVEDVLARTELTTWPEAAQLDYEVESQRGTSQSRRVITLVSTDPLEDGWHALRVRQDPRQTSSDGFGEGALSRFHVETCPLLLRVEAFGDDARLGISEALPFATFRGVTVSSLDGRSECRPGFSLEGPPGFSPGDDVNYTCDFEVAREGLKIEAEPSNVLAVPSKGEIPPEAFEGGERTFPQTYNAVPSEMDPMPECPQ